MNKFGLNFWIIFLPFHIVSIISLFHIENHWITFLVVWLLIGVIGNGVAAHRYFAHGQFEVWWPIRWILGILATLGAVAPIHYWIISHRSHHIQADTVTDHHSPVHNNWFYVFYAWTFPQGNKQQEYLQDRDAKKLSVKLFRDPFYVFFNKHHYTIIFTFCLILALIEPVYFLMYCLAYSVDFFRLGAVNYWCHRSGYRNFETTDATTNNLWLGWLGMGFGWHNNHHANPSKLILQHQWWEIDVEGYIGWILSKTKFN